MPRVTEETADARRNQILKAATACFAKNGLHRTTMKQICAAAKLSPGSVYTWFPSKQAIIREMSRRSLGSYRRALDTADLDPRRAIALYLDTIVQAAESPTAGRMNVYLLADTARDKFARDIMRSVAGEGMDVLRKAFRKLMPGDRAEADARARLFQAAAFGIVVQSVIDRRGDVASFELAKRLIAP